MIKNIKNTRDYIKNNISSFISSIISSVIGSFIFSIFSAIIGYISYIITKNIITSIIITSIIISIIIVIVGGVLALKKAYVSLTKKLLSYNSLIQSIVFQKEFEKKPDLSPYFDDQKFLQYLNKEELDRFKNWVMNNNDFHDEIDKWYKALSFYISEAAIDKATNNEITITSNEYVDYLIIKYFSVYQKEKEMKNLTLYYNKDKNMWWSQFPNEPHKEVYDKKIDLEKIEKKEDTDFKKHTTLWKDIKTGETWICGVVINFSFERWEQYKGNIETLQELKAEALEKALIDIFNKPKPPNQPH